MPDVENVIKEDLVDVGEKAGAEIDLGNKEEITLRNIKLRIVKNDYSPINTVGLNNIVLLLE